MKKYVIGIDYGTLSARALLVDYATGEEIASFTAEYSHGVMDEKFLDGSDLPANFALQHPRDYLEVLEITVKGVLSRANVNANEIAGIGFDFTACTILPVYGDGTPLCFTDEFSANPHAYVKLWKHHAAQPYADIINQKFADSGWIKQYGGKVSSEWMLPKIMEIAHKAPEVFDKADRFVEAGDWLEWVLTGNEVHSVAMAGFKGLYHGGGKFLDNDSLKSLDERFDGLVGTKVSDKVNTMNSLAGYLKGEEAQKLGLCEGVPVAICNIDAHSALPGTGIVDKGQMLMIIGTSSCEIFMDKTQTLPLGISGVVDGGIVDGLYAYEAGQCCVGDSFDWFVKNQVPMSYFDEAKEKNVSVHKILRDKAKVKKPGKSGLVALDWWGGNRSPLSDSDLTGVIVGLNLATKPEDIYRALIESTAYGARKIVETFEDGGCKVTEIFASGGIADKDEMTMQIYADVLGKEIKLSGSPLAGALGAAMSACVASGLYPDMKSCSAVMSKVREQSYKPIEENVKLYNKLYEEYDRLFSFFGKENDMMKRLKKIAE